MGLVARLAALACSGLILTGCSAFDQRRGPGPILDAAAVEAASANKSRILLALARDAGVVTFDAAGTWNVPPAGWYVVAKAGFNLVDDQCRSYFDELFFLNRSREQIKSGLVSGGQAAAAILGVTGASTLSLSVLAQAVGLSVNTTELVAGTYLYQLPPSTTQGFVLKLQAAFRDAAAARQGQINTPEAAYYMTQRYLDLCLPPRIEAEIIRQINGTVAGRVDTGNGALFSLETVSLPPVPPSVAVGGGLLVDSRPGVFREDPGPRPSSRRPTRRDEAPAGSGTSVLASLYRGSSFGPGREEGMARALRSLCLSTAEIRNPGPSARDLVNIYHEAQGAEPTGRIGDQDIRTLLGQPPCSAPHRNFYEKSRFPQGTVTAGTVRLLNKALPRNPVVGTPDLDAIRSQISAARTTPAVSSRLKPRTTDFSDQITSDLIDALESL